MHIADLQRAHLDAAERLALADYDRQRAVSPALPPMVATEDLSPVFENNLGVAALDGDRLVGFLVCCGPFPHAFRSTDATGVWSPNHMNAATTENRAAIYTRLYQASAEKWVRAGASSHGIGLYAWDRETQAQFFRLGFGMRTADGIRGMDALDAPSTAAFSFRRLAQNQFRLAFPLQQRLDAHMEKSPTFMRRPGETLEAFLESAAQPETRLYAAFQGSQVAAFLKFERSGETFIQNQPDYIHVTGAYCMPAYRGAFVVQNLLNCAIRDLKAAGYARLGVDFESINPAAHRFWQKHFDIYTAGLVRRIDEHALPKARAE